MNHLVAIDEESRRLIRELNNHLVALASEVKRIAVTLKLDEEALDRIIDNLPALDTAGPTAAEIRRDLENWKDSEMGLIPPAGPTTEETK